MTLLLKYDDHRLGWGQGGHPSPWQRHLFQIFNKNTNDRSLQLEYWGIQQRFGEKDKKTSIMQKSICRGDECLSKQEKARSSFIYTYGPPQNWSTKTFASNNLPCRLWCCPFNGLHPLQIVLSAHNVVASVERQIHVCETRPALPCSILTSNLDHQLKRYFARFSIVVV